MGFFPHIHVVLGAATHAQFLTTMLKVSKSLIDDFHLAIRMVNGDPKTITDVQKAVENG